MSQNANPEQSDSHLFNKGDRVRVIRCMPGLDGREGTVERFYSLPTYPVGVALDGDDGMRAFRLEELCRI